MQCREIESAQAEGSGALHGVPFAVKDNIDVAGRPTTAACPAFQYTPKDSAPCVQALLDQGDAWLLTQLVTNEMRSFDCHADCIPLASNLGLQGDAADTDAGHRVAQTSVARDAHQVFQTAECMLQGKTIGEGWA